MAEWLKAAVLKTVSGVTHSGVRIPLPPPEFQWFTLASPVAAKSSVVHEMCMDSSSTP
jgi:hypothetical protein